MSWSKTLCLIPLVGVSLHSRTVELVKFVDDMVFGWQQTTDPVDRGGQSGVYQLVSHLCLILVT